MRALNAQEQESVSGALLPEVPVHGRRIRDPLFDPLRTGFLGGDQYLYTLLMTQRPGVGDDDGGGDAATEERVEKQEVLVEVKKKAAETAEKLEEVVVEAQKCGIPLSTLFNFSTGESGAVWRECFSKLPQTEKDNLKIALTTIAAGMKLEESFNPITIAVNVMLHEERLMLGHLAAALSANDGWQFGENLATLSKGGWDSQLVLKLIQSVFKVTARGG